MTSSNTNRNRKRANGQRWSLALIVVLALVLGACGSDGAEEATTSEATGTTDAAEMTTSTEAASGDSFVDELVAQGSVDVGLVQSPPNSGITPEGDPEGMCPILASEALSGLGIPSMEMIEGEYSDMIPGLQSGRWDIVVACLTITPERCEEVIFSDPTAVIPYAFAVPPGNPDGLTMLADLVDNPELTVGVQTGTAEIQVMLDRGVQESQIVEFPDVRAAVSGLTAGRVDGVYTSYNSLAELGEPDSYELTDAIPDRSSTVTGFAFRPSDEGLQAAINEQLAILMETGRFAEIADNNGFNAEFVEDETTEAACAGD